MGKKKKRKLKMPPLSPLDRLIYWALLVLLCTAYLVLLLVPIWLRRRIAFADEMVVAYEGSVSALWLSVPWMTFFLMTFILWENAWQSRTPIFGRRNFQYGPTKWPKVYPLLMKNKPYVYISERKQRDRRLRAVVLLVVLLLSFIPLPWSLYGRTCLESDGSIVQYSMFNRQAREFSSGDIAHIQIETYRYSTGKHFRTTHWGVRMVFTTDSGKEYSFDHRDFRNDGQAEVAYWLTAMVNITQRYDPGILRIHGAENLDRVIEDRNLSAQETELLYRLFGQ